MGQKPVIVADTPVVQHQMLKHKLKLKDFNVPIILIDEVGDHSGRGKYFLFDEFPRILFGQKLDFAQKDYRLHPLFHMFNKEKIAAFSAHKSSEWENFVGESFDQAHISYHGSQLSKINLLQESEGHAVCCEDATE